MEYPVESGRNLTLKTKEQVFSVIDTTLLKCYLNVSKLVKIQNNQPLNTVFAQDILTVRPEQIVSALITKQQSDQGYHYLPFQQGNSDAVMHRFGYLSTLVPSHYIL